MLLFSKSLIPQIPFVALLIAALSDGVWGWQRSALIYHSDSRTVENFEKNFMRISENGQFTGQWLFDHCILTTEKINGVDIAGGDLTGNDLRDLLNKLFSDARQVEKAFSELRKSFPAPSFGKLKISIGFPYINSKNRIINLNNRDYHLNVRDERSEVVYWYIDQVRQFRASTAFQHLEIIGLYYHKEDIIDFFDDPEIVRRFNRKIHDLSMKSVWVPYYNAPHAYEGQNYGFDVEVVQPSYSFYSSIDGGSVIGDRLYAAGEKSAAKNQCFEYELSGNGESELEYWISHQYLAIAQFTSASKYPQVFFVGGSFFDSMQSKQNAPGKSWDAYTDLTDYLDGKSIWNYEVGISLSTTDNYDSRENALVAYWRVPSGYANPTSIRLDFNDANGYWIGRVVVRTWNQGELTSSFAQRAGPDILSRNYSSVFVPIADRPLCVGDQLAILVTRESQSTPWPNIIRLIAAKFEPPYISNPIFEELSSASRSNTEGPEYKDSKQTHRQYGAGKLTDGQITNDGWSSSVVVGWQLHPEGIFSVTLDLGRVVRVNIARICTHDDQESSVRVISKLTAVVAEKCAPHLHGTLELSCVPTATSGEQVVRQPEARTYSVDLPFTGNPSARYVTVSGVPLSWALLDEIQILDANGAVLSQGAVYKVTPIPGIQQGPDYADNERRLADGAIFKKWVFGKGADGFNDRNKGGMVSVLWDDTKMIRCAKVWLTLADVQKYGIGFPDYVDIEIRNANKQFNNPIRVAPAMNCVNAPCAKLCFSGSKVGATGVRATLPASSNWFMVTEISIE